MKFRVAEDGTLILSEVHNGVDIETEEGLYNIRQCNSGIEVRLVGRLVWSSTEQFHKQLLDMQKHEEDKDNEAGHI